MEEQRKDQKAKHSIIVYKKEMRKPLSYGN